MVQLVKYQLYQHKDLSLNLEHLCKIQEWWCISVTLALLRKRIQKDFQSSPAARPANHLALGSVSKGKVESHCGEDAQYLLLPP